MPYDDDLTDCERWAEDHGYWRGICRIHGPFWTDGTGCEDCLDEREEYEADKPEEEEAEDVAPSRQDQDGVAGCEAG